MRACLLLLACACLPGLTKDFSVNSGQFMVNQIPVASLAASGAPNPGATIRFDLSAPGAVGRRYQLATALGPGPSRCGCLRIPLTVDAAFLLSVSGRVPRVFENYAGTLDQHGRAVARLHLPRDRAMIGVRLYTAFVTLTTSTVTTGNAMAVSPPYVLSVVRK